MGGDYIDYIKYDEDRFAICIADISGKGVAAALLMANFQAMVQSLIFQYKDLETFIFALNQAVYRITKADKFITFFVAEINLRTRKLRYVNAGTFRLSCTGPMVFASG
ncbi:MAG: serine/threonine-protein phosphatase [Saprospiraceae bacterium]|nr:serine/threonine-protein phosphatase [Saprospiraceae bacterium]